MFGCVLCIAVHHTARLPTPKLLQLVAARSSLPMPRRPGVAQIVKPQILDACLLQGRVPSAVRQLPADRLALIGKAVARMLPDLFPGILFAESTRRKRASISEALNGATPYFFFGDGFEGGFMVSTTVVVGRRCASFNGINSPVRASRPILRAFVVILKILSLCVP